MIRVVLYFRNHGSLYKVPAKYSSEEALAQALHNQARLVLALAEHFGRGFTGPSTVVAVITGEENE